MTGEVPSLEAAPWPYTKAVMVHTFRDSDGSYLWDEVRLPPKPGAPKSTPFRRTPEGVVSGLAGGPFWQEKVGGIWRHPSKLGSRPREAVRWLEFPKMQSRPLYRADFIQNLDPGVEVLLCAGPKDAETALELGFLGATSRAFGESKLAPEQREALKGRPVVIIYDNDDAGIAAAEKISRQLERVATSVVVVPPLGDGEGYDLTNFVEDQRKAGSGIDEIARELDRRVDEAKAMEPVVSKRRKNRKAAPVVEEDGRARVVIAADEEATADAVVAALAARKGNLYQREGRLVRVVNGGDTGVERRPSSQPRISGLTLPNLRESMSSCCQFVVPAKDSHGNVTGEKEKPPPDWCVKAVMDRKEWKGVRHLSAVVEAPVFRTDGSVLAEPGHDPMTSTLFVGRPGVTFDKVPENPTEKDAKAACDLLFDVVCDVPFRGDADRAAWLALLLTAIGKPALNAVVPVTLIDAPVPGAGKTMLAMVVARIVLGVDAPATSWPSRNVDEQRKLITSILDTGAPIAVFDNITGFFGGAEIDRLLSQMVLQDRAMGKHETLVHQNVATWVATGNNFSVGVDTARRALQIRIVPDVARPELREGFKRQDLLGYCTLARGKLLPAALTILRWHWLTKRPHERSPDELSKEMIADGLKPFGGSFETWSRTIRYAVARICGGDPAETRTKLQDALNPTTAVSGLFKSIEDFMASRESKTFTAAQLVAEADRDDTFRDCLLEILPERARLNSRSVGKVLTRNADRWSDDRQLVHAATRSKIKSYRIANRNEPIERRL